MYKNILHQREIFFMPSFDIVSEVEQHELTNALDQSKRELTTRFDFRGVSASFEKKDDVILLIAEADLQLDQMLQILKQKMVKQQIDIKCLSIEDIKPSGKTVRQEIHIQQGIEKKIAQKIVKLIKGSKLKIQATIQDNQIRVTGKKRDDLQKTIAQLKEEQFDIPLQFKNFRD